MKIDEGVEDDPLMDIGSDLGITAGAGAGKTRKLVNRYVKLLEEGSKAGVKASNILALTYTDKAAAEMMDRVRKEVLSKEGEGWSGLADELNWANISTFHSFCTDLIRKYALECNITPNFEVLDENSLPLLMKDAFDLLLQGTGDELTDKSIVYLLTLGNTVNSKFMRACFEFMYENRSEIAYWVKNNGTEDALNAIYEKYRNSARTAIYQGSLFNHGLSVSLTNLMSMAQEILQEGLDEKTIERWTSVRNMLNDIVDESSIDQMDGYAQALDRFNVLLTSRDYAPGKMVPKALTDRFGEEYERVRNDIKKRLKTISNDLANEWVTIAPITDAQLRTMKKTANITMDLWKAYLVFEQTVERMKADRKALDFDDMILKAYVLLSDEKVKMDLSRRYRYILVDELQDTDRHQTEILRRLLTDWPDGKLFIVGDPKQSIFRFRNAEVKEFERLIKEIEKVKRNERRKLDTNYRSSPEIIDFVNRCFGPIITESAVPYEEMKISEKRGQDKGSVELLMVESDDKSPIFIEQSELIGEKIKDIVKNQTASIYLDKDGEHSPIGRPPKYGDFTILIATRTHLKELESALAKRMIPYHVHKGIGFYERQEVNDIYCLLRFLNDPADDVGLAGLLRSPFISIDDEKLYRLSTTKGWCLWSRIYKLSKLEDALGSELFQRLNRWLDMARRTPVSEALTSILTESGAIPIYAGYDDGEQVLANIHKAIETTMDMEAKGFGSLGNVVDQLELGFENNRREGQAALDLEAGNSVKIMTVHSAKGLEFPIVIVPFLDKNWNDSKGGFKSGEGVDIEFDFNIGLGLNPPNRQGEKRPDNIYRTVKASEDMLNQAEHGRLFYVAATRAQDHLIMVGRREVIDFGMPTSWMSMMMRAIPELKGVTEAANIDISSSRSMHVRLVQRSSVTSVDERAAPNLMGLEELGDVISWVGSKQVKQKDILNATLLSEHMYERNKRHFSTIASLREMICPSTQDAKKIGTAVHEVLRGRDIDTVLTEYDINIPRSEIESVRTRFLSSDLMSDVVFDLRELPFLSIIGGHRFVGKIDRLVRHADGSWTVIDYKTDRTIEGEDADLVARHSMQLYLYSWTVAKGLKMDISNALYFTHDDRVIKFGNEGKEGFEDELRHYEAYKADEQGGTH